MNIRRKRESRIILTLNVSPLSSLSLSLSLAPPSFMASTDRGVKGTHASTPPVIIERLSLARFHRTMTCSPREKFYGTVGARVISVALSIFAVTLTQNAKVESSDFPSGRMVGLRGITLRIKCWISFDASL